MKKLLLAFFLLLAQPAFAFEGVVPDGNLVGRALGAGAGLGQFVPVTTLFASPAFTGTASFAGSATGAITGDGSVSALLSQPLGTGPTANSIYRMTTNALVTNYDGVRSVVTNQPSSTVTNVSAISAYVLNNSPSAGNTVNADSGVGLFSVGVSAVNVANTWGLNTLLTDNTSYATSTGTGRVLWGIESDFNVTSPSTVVHGIEITGASLAQPAAGSEGFIVNPIGTGIHLDTAFVSRDGAANNALVIGQTAAGATSASQFILLRASNGGANTGSVLQALANGTVNWTPAGVSSSYNLQIGTDRNLLVTTPGSGAGINLNSTNNANSALQPMNIAASVVNLGSPLVPQVFTVAGLPVCNTASKFQLMEVSDANAPAYGVALAGGGTSVALALCDGTSWKAH
jgi:hypothetical protein